MKYIAILLTALSFCTLDVQAQKFGHVNSQLLLDTLPETAVAQAELEAINLEFEKELQLQQADLELLVTQIQAMQADPAVSDFTKQSKISKYESDQQRLQETYTVAQQQLAAKEQELLAPIIEKAREAIKEVGKENGFVYIFDLNSGGIIYEGGEDVLPLVLAKLGQ
ncbi:MAG TPA: molecular chaperone Skp [Flavobacteriales bacterium]|nr:molecular chaperone Skp [Flavobacteriales bacterium]|tara:strand:+ start:465 stop:965 length:501 start_codon:yes stop_codon:yes gene_type:complete